MEYKKEKSDSKPTTVRLTELELAICNFLAEKEGYSNRNETIRFILRNYFLSKYSYEDLNLD